MPKFKCEAMDSEGKTVRREVQARNTDQAVAKLREQDLFPTRVKEVSEKKTAKQKAAEHAGIERESFHRLMRKCDIKSEEIKRELAEE